MGRHPLEPAAPASGNVPENPKRGWRRLPCLIKLGVEDGFTGGLTLAEGTQACRLLAETGYDAIEVSSGVRGEKYEGTEYKTKINKPSQEGYFRIPAREIKKMPKSR